MRVAEATSNEQVIGIGFCSIARFNKIIKFEVSVV